MNYSHHKTYEIFLEWPYKNRGQNKQTCQRIWGKKCTIIEQYTIVTNRCIQILIYQKDFYQMNCILLLKLIINHGFACQFYKYCGDKVSN